MPGIRFYPVRFTPPSSKYANEECQGVFIIVTDRAALRPVRVGVEIAAGAAQAVSGAGPARVRRTPVRLARGAGADPDRRRSRRDRGVWGAAEARWRLLQRKVFAVSMNGSGLRRESGFRNPRTRCNPRLSRYIPLVRQLHNRP